VREGNRGADSGRDGDEATLGQKSATRHRVRLSAPELLVRAYGIIAIEFVNTTLLVRHGLRLPQEMNNTKTTTKISKAK
jgi:hypothetical protein